MGFLKKKKGVGSATHLVAVYPPLSVWSQLPRTLYSYRYCIACIVYHCVSVT